MRSPNRFGSGSIVLVVLLIIGSAVQAQTNRSTISGFVFDSDRRPIVQTPVELLNDMNSVLARTRTDGSGRYFFGGLPHGRFTVKVLPFATDLEQQSVDVEISGIGITGRPMSGTVHQDIYLRRRQASASAPTVNAVIYAQDVPQEAQEAYKNALSDLRDKRIGPGIESLEKAISIFPEYFDALQSLGLVLMGQEKYGDAREAFSRAVKINERSFDCWYGIGHSSYLLNDSNAAIQAAEKAVALKPDSVKANLVLGISYRQGKNYEKSETALKQAARLGGGESPEVHWNLALLYAHNLNRYKDAAEQLEMYLKAAKDIPNEDAVRKLIKQFRQKASASRSAP